MDLSGLDSAKNLRDVVMAANVYDGKLLAIPQEVVALKKLEARTHIIAVFTFSAV